MVQRPRRFRNAIFHFQREPVGPNLMAFLETNNSEVWVNYLNEAFEYLFIDELNFMDILNEIGGKSDTNSHEEIFNPMITFLTHLDGRGPRTDA